MRRKEAREKVMHLLFQMDAHNEYSNDFLNRNIDDSSMEGNQADYIKNIAILYITNKDKIDHIIEENSKDWKLNRIAKVDLAILRVAITEIYYFNDIPHSVSINEAVELAKTFSTEESGSFINGILGNIAKVM